MINVTKLCESMTEKISKEIELTQDQKDVINYGLFSTFQIFLSIILTFIVGFIFGVHEEALIISLSISILRKSSGGAHAKTPNKCILVSIVVGVLLGIISVNINTTSGVLMLSGVILFAVGFILCLKYAPVDSENKPIKKAEKRKRLKRISICTISIFFIISLAIIVAINYTDNFNLSSYVLSIYMGTGWQLFSLTPIGIKILNKIS